MRAHDAPPSPYARLLVATSNCTRGAGLLQRAAAGAGAGGQVRGDLSAVTRRRVPSRRLQRAGGILPSFLTLFCAARRNRKPRRTAAMHSKLAVAAATALGAVLVPVAAFAPLHSSIKLASPAAASRLGGGQFRRAAAAARPALLSLRAQDSRLGWVGRPGSSMPPAEMQMSELGTLSVDGADICYDFLPGDGPTIFFLPALNQTRHGAKANALKTWCRRQGRSFLVADYFATGKSDGEYKDATISRWAADTAKLIDHIAKEKNVEKYTLVSGRRCVLCMRAT
jgi:hypothetical protein